MTVAAGVGLMFAAVPAAHAAERWERVAWAIGTWECEARGQSMQANDPNIDKYFCDLAYPGDPNMRDLYVHYAS
ncbi:hypothetical protein AB0C52_06320 [Streptomyces sp. NPDC048717]|uniref:hypothetical protein n=1 Tax=unclassified Streptomyces TaxID=2593676 RepID=UPI00343F787E